MKNIVESNKLIVEFMGYSRTIFMGGAKDNGSYYVEIPNYFHDHVIPDDLKFHSDWDWLMQVVEKIESLNFVVQVHLNSCFIKEREHFINNKAIWRGKNHAKTKIEAVYNACVEFIEWYNKQY